MIKKPNMKQFITRIIFTILIYFVGCILAESLNPIEWKYKEATFWWLVIIIFIWLIPICINYLGSKENFK